MFAAFLISFILLPDKEVNAVQTNNAISMKISYGYEGNFKLGKFMPVQIEIENKGENIDGTVQIEVPKNNYEYMLYESAAALPKDSKKKIMMNIPVFTNIKDLKVKITNKTRVVHEQMVDTKLGRIEGNMLLVGALSDDYNSISYFNSGKLEIVQPDSKTSITAPTKLVKLDETTFPELPNGLSAIDVILINNFDTSKLSNLQYEALKTWVKRGGNLIIGTGPSNAKTLAVFKDGFISGEIGEISKVHTSSLTALINKKEVNPITLDVVNIQMKEGENVLSQDQSTLVKKLQRGSGSVGICNFDLGLEPMTSWKGNEAFASLLYKEVVSTQYADNMLIQEKSNQYWRLREILTVVPDGKLPSVKGLLIILMIYILVIGPVSYQILKKLDKRYLMWAVVPGFSIIFTGIIFGVGGTTRFTKPFINVANIITINSDGKGSSIAYAGVTTPYKKTFTLQVPTDYDMIPISDEEYHGDPNLRAVRNKVLHSTITNQGGDSSITYKESAAFKTNMITFTDPSYTSGNLKTELTYIDGKLTGTVQNQLGVKLEDAFICSNGIFVKLGEIKEQEIKKLGDKIETAGSIYEISERMYGDIYAPVPFANNKVLRDRIKKRQRRSLLEMYFDNGKSGEFDKPYFVAFATAPTKYNVKIDSNPVSAYQTTIVIAPISLKFEHNGIVEYPYGFIKPDFDSAGSNGGYDEMGNMFYGESVKLHFNLDKGIHIEKISFQDLGKNNNNRFRDFNGKFYLYNLTSKSYEEFDYKKDIIKGEVLKQYVDQNGVVKIQLENTTTNKDEPMAVPVVSMKGRVK